MKNQFDPVLIRREYSHEKDMSDDFLEQHPQTLFKEWFHDATVGGVLEPDAMNLATFDGKNVNSRTVALRGITENGIQIFTNYNSSKAREMDRFPNVSVTFHWRENFRQIRMRGTARRASEKQSDEYFATRPRSSQVGAWISRQSTELSSRDELIEEYQKFDAELGEKVQRPPFWGGYVIDIDEYDFMQGRSSRLHDRARFIKDNKGQFTGQRLWP